MIFINKKAMENTIRWLILAVIIILLSIMFYTNSFDALIEGIPLFNLLG